MRRQSKKALYESIMRDVAKVVKRRLNESNPDLISREEAEDIIFQLRNGEIRGMEYSAVGRTKPYYKMDMLDSENRKEHKIQEMKKIVERALRYIKQDSELSDFVKQFGPRNIEITTKIPSCSSDEDCIYLNPDFIKSLTADELAFVIIHEYAHMKFNDEFDYDRIHDADEWESANIDLDKKVNRFIEGRFPQFRGYTKRLNGYI